MDWLAAVAYGVAGGAVVEAVSVWGNLAAWQAARHRARRSGRRLPGLTRYLDPQADALVALSRLVLGGLAALLLHDQISGAMSAVAVGASAPALLTQFGTSRYLPSNSEAAAPTKERTP